MAKFTTTDLGATPTAPDPGQTSVYSKADGLYIQNSAGQESKLGGPENIVPIATINRSSYTGSIEGGVGSINVSDNATFDITAGSGQIVDPYSDVENPTLIPFTWDAFVGVAVTHIADTSSVVGVNSAGELVQFQLPSWGATQRRDLVQLVILVHPGTVVISVVPYQDTAYGHEDDTVDFKEAVGPVAVEGLNYINAGTVISPNGANLSVNISAGSAYTLWANRGSSNKTQSLKSFAGATPTNLMFRVYRNGSGGWNVSPTPVSTLNPGNWDDGSGILQSVGAEQYTLVQVYFFASNTNVLVHYGQALYESIADAYWARKQATVSHPILLNALFRGWIIVCGAASDLTDPTQALFLPADKFGESRETMAPLFGADFQQVTDITYRPNASATFAEVATLNTTVLPPGTYRIDWTYMWSHTNSNTNFRAQVELDDTINLYEQSGSPQSVPYHQEEPADSAATQRIVTASHAFVTFAVAGAHFIDIDIASSSGAIAAVHRTTISIHRVA